MKVKLSVDKIIWGSFFIIGGALFLLNNMGIINADVFNMLWPLLIILIGVNIIFSKHKKGK